MKVIALQSVEEKGWAYGYEFDHPEGPELDDLIAAGVLRVDDRLTVKPSKANGKKKG